MAGLASIGTARGMGAVVSAYDVRPVVREQVSEEYRDRQDTYGQGQAEYSFR